MAKTMVWGSKVRIPSRSGYPNPELRGDRSNGGIVRDAGKLSKLPDMPLDILYEVSYNPVSANSIDGDTFDVTDFLSCPSNGPTAGVMDQQDLS